MDDRLRAVLAGRFDTHTNYDDQFSPKAALVYTVAPGHNVRATYNRAFKSPTVLESFLYIPIDLTNVVPGYFLLAGGNIDGYNVRNAGGDVVRSIDALSPEEVNTVELGYKGVLGSKLFVDAVGYYSWYTDFISPLTTVADGFEGVPFDENGDQVMLDQANFTGLLTYFNFGESEVRGLDLGLNYYFTDEINASVSYSHIDRVNFESESGGDFLLNVPEDKIKGSLTIGDLIGPGSFLNISSRWNSAYKFASGSHWISENLLDDGEVPSRFVTDITAGYQIPNSGLSAKVSASNVFNNERIPVLGAPVRERLLWFSLTYKFDGLQF
jgi:iron complex outermembrane receptor protein